MKHIIFFLLALSPVLAFSQARSSNTKPLTDTQLVQFQGHEHSPDPRITPSFTQMLKDTVQLKAKGKKEKEAFVITYVVGTYQCSLCGLAYNLRHNIDTFSTVKKANHSNLTYKKPKQ